MQLLFGHVSTWSTFFAWFLTLFRRSPVLSSAFFLPRALLGGEGTDPEDLVFLFKSEMDLKVFNLFFLK